MTQKWQRREISNFEYLMFLNTIAGEYLCFQIDRFRLGYRLEEGARESSEDAGLFYGCTRADGVCRGALGMFSISPVFR